MSLARRKNLDHYRKMERERQQRARAKIRGMVNEIKTSAGCKNCSETHPACLHFHHRDPAKKEFRVNRAVAEKKPLAAILSEIAKCDVLCANCHAKLHWPEMESQ